MKKKKANKVEKVEQKEVQAKQTQPERVHPLQAWDNLMFMRRRPIADTKEQTKDQK
jgi:hypothetical protein